MNKNGHVNLVLPRQCEVLILQKYVRLFSSYQLNAHFLYSITIYMLNYNPQHVSSSTLLIFRGQIVLLQPLVSSLSVKSRTVCRLRADWNTNILAY